MEQDIIGGVSPLKARQASRGGKHAGAATRTAKQRGGFAKSKGKRGAGGANVGGYNVRTRFKVDPWTPSGGGTTKKSPDPKPAVTVDDKGTVTVNKPEGWKEYVPGVDPIPGREEKKESKGTFKDVWAANEDNFQDKWKDKGGYEGWKEQAQKEIDEGYYDSKFIEGTAGKPGYWLHYNAQGEVVKREEGGPDLYDQKTK